MSELDVNMKWNVTWRRRVRGEVRLSAEDRGGRARPHTYDYGSFFLFFLVSLSTSLSVQQLTATRFSPTGAKREWHKKIYKNAKKNELKAPHRSYYRLASSVHPDLGAIYIVNTNESSIISKNLGVLQTSDRLYIHIDYIDRHQIVLYLLYLLNFLFMVNLLYNS